jgi:hypothetical protein
MITLKGKLEFISFWSPIRLDVGTMELDLRDDYFRVFKNLNGKKATMDCGMNHIRIFADDASDRVVYFEIKKDPINPYNDKILMILNNVEGGWGMSNLGSYAPDILQRLNGMQVIVEYDDESISIKHDESEKVFELNYTHINSCKIPDNKVKEICKIGESDCCIFVTAGSNGFMCEKFNYMASGLLERYSKGTMRASRIGNCKIVGRIDAEEDK